MKLAVRLQAAGMALVVAGLLLLFGIGVAIIAAGVLSVAAGALLEREHRAATLEPAEVR